MISHGPSNLTTQQLIDMVAEKLSANEYDDALTLIDQCDNLDDIDFNWTALDGLGKGQTLLYLTGCLATVRNTNTLLSIFNKLKTKPLDFNKPAENELDKGKTPLWLACLAASFGQPKPLEFILDLPSELISTLDFNKPAENELNKGITPLWFACLAASNGYPEALKAIRELPSELISPLDFNKPSENERDKGITPLWLTCLAFSNGFPEALKAIRELPSELIKTLDFNKPSETERDNGITPLWLTCLAASKGRPEALKVILDLPSELISTLDFNKPAENEQDKGITPLWLACLGASNGHPEGLKAILEALPSELISTLDFNKPAENELGNGKTPLWFACLAASKGRPEALKAILALPSELISPLDFNKPTVNEKDKGITPLWLACLGALKGHPEVLTAILALPKQVISTLDFNKPAENGRFKEITPFWQLCKAATIGHPEALMAVIQNIPYKSLDFDSMFNLSNSERLRFFFSKVKELSQAMAQLSDDNLHDVITTLEQLSKIEIEDKPHMKWIVEKASTEIIFALLNRDISRTGENLDPSMFMFDILRTQAIEHALTHACTLSDELLKAHCVRKLLNISPISSDQKDILDWMCKYKNSEDIIDAIRLYKAKQRDLELLDIKSKLKETESELEAKKAIIQEMQTQLDDLAKQFQLSSGYLSTQNESITPQFQGKLYESSTFSRSNTGIGKHDANQALEPKKRKPKS